MAKKPHFSRFSALREAAAGWRRAEPRQAGRLAAVGKFFAAMLVLTLAARGLAGASMPVVTLTGATSGSITQTRTVAGRLSNNLVVEFAGDEALIGQYVRVHFTDSKGTILKGKLV